MSPDERFQTRLQAETYERVLIALDGRYPGLVQETPSLPSLELSLAVHNGSARTFVAVLPHGEGECLIRTTAWVIRDVDPSLELYRDLLSRSGTKKFGGYFINEEGDVGFSHTIIGSTLDDGELFASVVAVATTADEEDDDLRNTYGGRRAVDDAPSA